MNFVTPVTDHPKLPDGVPLVADFDDDRNRLSYYHPQLRTNPGVRVPQTIFLDVAGSLQSHPEIEYRELTRWMQDQSLRRAFVRGDFSSGKLDGDSGSLVEGQDPHIIETTVLELLRQLFRAKRSLGGRIALREWIPHDVEVRYFIRNGQILYADTLDGVERASFPDPQAGCVADMFDRFAWSVDFIRHETTGKWYCTDLGLDGLYWSGTEWIAISEHMDDEHSPEQCADQMADPERYLTRT